jgi:multicomponent Na+:H+ antiporter subunit D
MMSSLQAWAASIPPGLILILGGLLVPLIPKTFRKVWMLALPLLGLAQMWLLPLGFDWTLELFGSLDLQIVRLDRLSRIFGTIFHIAACITVLYSLKEDDDLQHVAGLTYAGSAIGAVFAGDLITLFIYWELTAVTSVFLIWARRTARSYKVGLRYLVVQVLSGVLLLAGSMIRFGETQSLEFGLLGDPFESVGTGLIFLAFGIKAAFPMLHAWLEDAYPEATVGGTVWLSAFTTKLAIYALARGFAGTDILIPIGATMTAFPIFFAVIENDLRRVLAYSLNNQLGYMVVGIGIGTELALNGAAAHAFAHILYKGLLFMSMGAVLQQAGTVNGSDLGGLWKKMPWTTAFCIIGAMAISAFPLFSGFVTKSMILTAAADEHHTLTFLILLFASAGVFHHSGIKIPYFAFFAHKSEAAERVKGEAPLNMLIAMGIAAFFCIAIGVFPEPLYALLPFDTQGYTAYDVTHVVTQSQLLLFSALAFVFLQKMGWYPPELRSVVLDVDWIYRKPLKQAALWSARLIGRGVEAGKQVVFGGAASVVEGVGGLFVPGQRKLSLGDPWPSGMTAACAAGVLVVYLLVAYLAG